MQFADPAWQPKVTREFEAITPPSSPTSGDGATHAGAGATDFEDYAQGYRPSDAHNPEPENLSQNQQPPFSGQQPPFQGQQPPFQAQQPLTMQSLQDAFKRLPVWAWWVIGIIVVSSIAQSASHGGGFIGALFSLLFIGALVLGGWLLYTRRVRISLSGETQAAETRTFTVGARPTVVLKNKAGSIKLRAGQEDQVSITTTRRGYLFSPRFDRETPISFDQNSATNTVTARTGSWRLFGKNAITFEVVVPPESDLQLTTSMGTISVENVAGQLTLKSDAGTIDARGVTLRGKSRIKGDVGTITFAGALDPSGTYEIETDMGTIDVTLPADASFELSAKTDIGTVTTNFPVIQPQRNKAYGPTGSAPQPRLKVKTDIGSITIQRR